MKINRKQMIEWLKDRKRQSRFEYDCLYQRLTEPKWHLSVIKCCNEIIEMMAALGDDELLKELENLEIKAKTGENGILSAEKRGRWYILKAAIGWLKNIIKEKEKINGIQIELFEDHILLTGIK